MQKRKIQAQSRWKEDCNVPVFVAHIKRTLTLAQFKSLLEAAHLIAHHLTSLPHLGSFFFLH